MLPKRRTGPFGKEKNDHREAAFRRQNKNQEKRQIHMNKLRIGIVGAGRIGNVHAESITYHIPEAEVVMVTDVI